MNSYLEKVLHEFDLPLQNPVLVFSVLLFIILLSPVILRRFNIPAIIGLIISGVIVGPYGFNILEKNSAIELFSTIGLLYIMFIAGLELDLNEFKAHRNKSLLFGFFTFIIPLGLGFPVTHYLLGYGFDASLLISSMFATHTLVAYPIVSRLGIAKNQAVAITVGGTILTDTAVLVILAVITSKSEGALDSEFIIRMGVSLMIFTFIMFWLVPPFAKWFFKKLESEKQSHYIFVLSVVFFAAFLAEIAGVEPIIGAFMAGLALNKLIPHSSTLMNRIEFIGNSLFIPFFLIAVGMLVDVSVLLRGPQALIVAATLTVVALVGKWFAAFFTQITFKYNSNQRQLIFGLSASHAAATLAVITVGFKAGLLDENILNGTILLILITCIVASFATEKAAKKIVSDNESENPSTSQPKANSAEHILVPIANIENVESLIDFGILIKDKKSLNPISILSVVTNNEEAEANILKARNKLEAFVKHASASETKVNIVATIDHNPASGIARISREILADIIILGWPKKAGVIEKIIGEKMDSILHSNDRTTFVSFTANPFNTHKRIIMAMPPFAESEVGFVHWMVKVMKFAQELSLPILLFSNSESYLAVETFMKKNKVSVGLRSQLFTDWDDFLILSKYINLNDIIFLISARKNSASYINQLDGLPSKIEKHFPENSRIVVFPQLYDRCNINPNYEDISAGPLIKGIETVQKIGKGIGHIFKP